MASASSVAVGVHCPGALLCSTSRVRSSNCSPRASSSTTAALKQRPRSMLRVTIPSSACGRDVLARTSSTTTGEARTVMMLRGSRKCMSRLDSRSGFGTCILWSGQAGSGVQSSGISVFVPRSSSSKDPPTSEDEEVFFDGGVHYGDLVTNLVFGLTLVWLPLTFAAIFRNLFLRYRFTDKRITIQSGLLGGDRKDFTYDVVTDVKVVPRFIGEWGDMALELKDGTKVDIRAVPKFRQIAKYIEEQSASAKQKATSVLSPSGRGAGSRKGFS